MIVWCNIANKALAVLSSLARIKEDQHDEWKRDINLGS
jgi:hypothetical protein